MIACARGWDDAKEPADARARRAPRHDWSARARSTAMEALRYTQFVGVMKRALPVAAFAVIAAVLAYFFVARQPARVTMGYQRLGHVENDLAMIKPRLTGQDAKGNPFVITADSGSAGRQKSQARQAHQGRGRSDPGQDGWINANAARGLVDMNAGALELDGGINVFSDQGYELHTASASVDLNKGVVHGHEEVTGHGPLGDSARRPVPVRPRQQTFSLWTGHVQMTIVGTRT